MPLHFRTGTLKAFIILSGADEKKFRNGEGKLTSFVGYYLFYRNIFENNAKFHRKYGSAVPSCSESQPKNEVR